MRIAFPQSFWVFPLLLFHTNHVRTHLITPDRLVTIDENAGFENAKEYNSCEDKHETAD